MRLLCSTTPSNCLPYLVSPTLGLQLQPDLLHRNDGLLSPSIHRDQNQEDDLPALLAFRRRSRQRCHLPGQLQQTRVVPTPYGVSGPLIPQQLDVAAAASAVSQSPDRTVTGVFVGRRVMSRHDLTGLLAWHGMAMHCDLTLAAILDDDRSSGSAAACSLVAAADADADTRRESSIGEV